MRALTSIEMMQRGSSKACPANSRIVEKASKIGAFGKDNNQSPHENPRHRPRLQIELVCQTETKPHDPFWDGPRLSPIFATQLLGQVMEPEHERLVRTAYGRLTEKSARLFDEKV